MGLVDQLIKMYTPPKQLFCQTKSSSGPKPLEKFRLNLKSLASAFVVLFVGVTFSSIVYVGERIIDRRHRGQNGRR